MSTPSRADPMTPSAGFRACRRVTRPAKFRLDFPQVLHMCLRDEQTLNVQLKPVLIHRVGKQETPGPSEKESLNSGYSTGLSTPVVHRLSGLVRTLSTELSTGRVACG